MSYRERVIKAIKDHCPAFVRLGFRLLSLISYNEYSGVIGNRSASDNGKYLSAVRGALKSYSKFSNFKRHPFYRQVLEHITKELGEDYLKIVMEENPQFLEDPVLMGLRRNDDVGNPIKYTYPQVGEISPTTLRYIKVASDLQIHFGDDLGSDIVEIGCGYGGQFLVLDQLFEINRYKMFDLPLVCELISKVIESYTINGSYCTTTLNQYQPGKVDLVISNYAFSELPRKIQLMYVKKVLSKSSKGYLTMNSGKRRGVSEAFRKLSLKELKEVLPDCEVIEEHPLSSPFNYIILWGHQR